MQFSVLNSKNHHPTWLDKAIFLRRNEEKKLCLHFYDNVCIAGCCFFSVSSQSNLLKKRATLKLLSLALCLWLELEIEHIESEREKRKGSSWIQITGNKFHEFLLLLSLNSWYLRYSTQHILRFVFFFFYSKFLYAAAMACVNFTELKTMTPFGGRFYCFPSHFYFAFRNAINLSNDIISFCCICALAIIKAELKLLTSCHATYPSAQGKRFGCFNSHGEREREKGKKWSTYHFTQQKFNISCSISAWCLM